MKKLFAENLEVDTRCVELLHSIRSEQGLELGFTIYSKLTQHVRIQRLKTFFKSSMTRLANPQQPKPFVRSIIDEFGSSPNDNIKIDKVYTVYLTDTQTQTTEWKSDLKYLIQSSFYKNNQNLFKFEKMGIYKSISIDVQLDSNNDNNDDDVKSNVHKAKEVKIVIKSKPRPPVANSVMNSNDEPKKKNQNCNNLQRIASAGCIDELARNAIDNISIVDLNAILESISDDDNHFDNNVKWNQTQMDAYRMMKRLDAVDNAQVQETAAISFLSNLSFATRDENVAASQIVGK